MTLFDTLRRSRLARISLTRREPTEATAVRLAAPPEPAAAALPEGAPRLRDWIGVLAMGTGLFMAIMDVQIVTSSLTQIQGGLSASTDEIAWVQTAYLIADAVMVPMSGIMSAGGAEGLYDRYATLPRRAERFSCGSNISCKKGVECRSRGASTSIRISSQTRLPGHGSS